MAKVSLSQANFVTRGYGQVEPNHLSAQRNGKIYAQLPATTAINVLENGQFVKYDYANEAVNFSGPAEWMLVFNEVKVYRDGQGDADFAMVADNYKARIYSPIDGAATMKQTGDARDYSGQVTPADPYEVDSTATPFAAAYDYTGPKAMPTNTKMVPRVFKTDVGDIFTTNMVNLGSTSATGATEFKITDSTGTENTLYVKVGDVFVPGSTGILEPAGGSPSGMQWQVVKIYDLGDRQPAVKVMRIA